MKAQRQAFITEKVKRGEVTSQRQLVKLLSKEGFEVSQTTVSRDLRELGLSKGFDTEGKSRYGEPEALRDSSLDESKLKRLAPQFLLTAEATGNMVVVKTSPGNAQGLAAALDSVRIEGVAGTVAGDDTILVVCSAGVKSSKVCDVLLRYAFSQR